MDFFQQSAFSVFWIIIRRNNQWFMLSVQGWCEESSYIYIAIISKETMETILAISSHCTLTRNGLCVYKKATKTERRIIYAWDETNHQLCILRIWNVITLIFHQYPEKGLHSQQMKIPCYTCLRHVLEVYYPKIIRNKLKTNQLSFNSFMKVKENTFIFFLKKHLSFMTKS